MEFFILYLVAMAVVASVITYDIYLPALKTAQKQNISNEITEYPKLSGFVFWCISCIAAPLLVLLAIIPNGLNNFADALADQFSR